MTRSSNKHPGRDSPSGRSSPAASATGSPSSTPALASLKQRNLHATTVASSLHDHQHNQQQQQQQQQQQHEGGHQTHTSPNSGGNDGHDNSNGGNGAASGLLVQQPPAQKYKNFLVRSQWTLVMVAGFLGLLAAGHVWVMFLGLAVSVAAFKEILSIVHVPTKETRLPYFRTINWYFFFATTYYLYGESVIYYLKPSILVDAFYSLFAINHRFISFALYTFGIILFVLTLKKGHYKFQFSQFAWTHLAILLVVCQTCFFLNNIFEGLIWFVLPVLLVVVNDVMAYIFGFFFGKTPLIQLSPKKTWEGFLGAFASTLLFGFFSALFLSQFDYMICPIKDLRTSILSNLTCVREPVYLPIAFQLPPAASSFIKHISSLDVRYVYVSPFQWHAVAMSFFASIIAPFGGFFASGVKRAFNIKDFGDSIPGHGGITDRVDCLFLMGFFANLYFNTFVKSHHTSVGSVLQLALALTAEEQLELYQRLHELLVERRLLN